MKIVIIKYNNMVGRIDRIHTARSDDPNGQQLFNIEGVDGFYYPNQHKNEIIEIENFEQILTVLNKWKTNDN